MAMELFVLSDRKLESIAQWQDAISAEGFPLRLSTETPFEELDGFLPAQLGEKQAGFECAHWDVQALMQGAPELDFGHHWRHALSFRWGGSNMYETPATYMASAAYAKATGGIVYDYEQGELITPQRAAEIGREVERDIPMMEEMMPRILEDMEARLANLPTYHVLKPRPKPGGG